MLNCIPTGQINLSRQLIATRCPKFDDDAIHVSIPPSLSGASPWVDVLIVQTLMVLSCFLDESVPGLSFSHRLCESSLRMYSTAVMSFAALAKLIFIPLAAKAENSCFPETIGSSWEL